jgi:hypothetical protein
MRVNINHFDTTSQIKNDAKGVVFISAKNDYAVTVSAGFVVSFTMKW